MPDHSGRPYRCPDCGRTLIEHSDRTVTDRGLPHGTLVRPCPPHRLRVPAEDEFTSAAEVLIGFRDTRADDLGNRQFLAFWIADDVGPTCNEHGVRGQAYRTNPDHFTDRERSRGRTVRVISDPGRSKATPPQGN